MVLTPYTVKPLNTVRKFRQRGLWFTRDHLLVVQKTLLVERYRRIYFTDLEAVVVEKSIAGAVLTTILLTAVLFLISFNFIPNSAWNISPKILALCNGTAVIYGCGLLVHLFLGPTCRVRIRTAASSLKLPGISRMRNARKFLKSLEAAMAAGDFSPSLSTPDGAIVPVSELHSALRGIERSIEERPALAQKKPFRPVAHLILFTLLLIDALIAGILSDFNHLWLHIAGTILLFPLACAIAAALALQRSAKFPLRLVTWGAFGYVSVFIVVGMIYGQVHAAGKPETAGNAWKLMQAVSAIQPDPDSAYTRIQTLASTISFTIALLGFGALGHQLVTDKREKK